MRPPTVGHAPGNCASATFGCFVRQRGGTSKTGAGYAKSLLTTSKCNSMRTAHSWLERSATQVRYRRIHLARVDVLHDTRAILGAATQAGPGTSDYFCTIAIGWGQNSMQAGACAPEVSPTQ